MKVQSGEDVSKKQSRLKGKAVNLLLFLKKKKPLNEGESAKETREPYDVETFQNVIVDF